MLKGLSGDYSAGLTRQICNMLAVYAIDLVGLDASGIWLIEDGVHPMRLFQASTWCPIGGGGTLEVGGTTTAESLVRHRSIHNRFSDILYRVSKQNIRRERRADQSLMGQRSAGISCARIKSANSEFFSGES